MSLFDSAASALMKRGLEAMWPRGEDGPRSAHSPLQYEQPIRTRIAMPEWQLARAGLPTLREAKIVHASARESYNESRTLAEFYGLGVGTAVWVGTRIAFRV